EDAHGGAHTTAVGADAPGVSNADYGDANDGAAATEAHHGEGEHHATAPWLKRLYTTLWMNNIYFVGLGIIGLFFVAIQYGAQAGWSAGILRIPLAMGSWIPIAGILTLVLWFLVKDDVFHWVHKDLYNPEGPGYDAIIDGKGTFFFWPLAD